MAYISRIKVRGDAKAAALAPLLLPSGEGERGGAMHRVMWSIHTDGPDRGRDFLWREDEGAGGERRYISVSARPPSDVSGLFDVETKPYEPELEEGDRLSFSLRANATRSIPLPDGARGRGRRVDVVIAELHATRGIEGPYGPRRDEVAARVASEWMEQQGSKKGFRLRRDRDDRPWVSVDAYRILEMPRVGARPIRLGILDLSGELVVTSPGPMVETLLRGLGHGRAFGLGLMLVRRSRG